MTRPRSSGFSLIEVLISVGIIVVLLTLVLLVAGEAKASAYRVQCMGNLRALTLGWLQYTRDNNDALMNAGTGIGGWVSSGNTVTALSSGPMYPYVQSPDTYKCPADAVSLANPAPNLAQPDDANRSYSIMSQMNGAYKMPASASAPWAGKVLPYQDQYSMIAKPQQYIVFIEEYDPRGWNLGSFVIPPSGLEWVDFPAIWHSNGNCVSFADGHTEYIRFTDTRTIRLQSFHNKTDTVPNPDQIRLQSLVYPN